MRLMVWTERAGFFIETQWLYMVHHPQEAQRGQDPDSDLFSPGYFSGPLAGDQSEILGARCAGER
jgi:starch synthase (maltosyl-transferring)